MTLYQKRIWNRIEKEHGYAHYVSTHPVKEVFKDQVVWEGEVEEFKLTANYHAQTCYGWAAEKDNGKEEITIVLGIPPVDSPETAVKVAIAAHATKHERIKPWFPKGN